MTAEPPPRSDGSDPEIDVDAAFADIVARWGPVGPVGPVAPVGPGEEPGEPARSGPGAGPGLGPVLTPEPTPEAVPEPIPEPIPPSAPQAEDDDHFVPPPPPPLPVVEPRRMLAWIGLFGTPLLLLLLLLARITIPAVLSVGLVCAFLGGFAYLVATMGSSAPDEWSGDDGAVL